ncbi:hypothetical protein [Gloeothece verrucosa]|uniref:Uncharacterized protein n=1 Tax=Gloeothece verrucosa (strain PCC 7822) TaxID=497965 RepID=E0UEM7_GLOV7|nr:hypothetical protein [Gloeothece verrucosa]ADN16595.1 hypothetical protein Cyan7822_4690 [Gloeothece verrucosa PCC 7822]
MNNSTLTNLNSPDIDIIAVWPGFGKPDCKNAQFDSTARVRIWTNKTPVIVVFSDLDGLDTGCSITNCSENLATLVKLHYKLTEPITWLEHYPRHNRSEIDLKINKLTEDVSQVFYCTKNGYYFHPRWKHLDLDAARKMIGHSLSMDGEFNLPVVRLVTPYEQQRMDFEAGLADAKNGVSKIADANDAYQQGYSYGLQLNMTPN